jgi:glycosyltransferase involved in cell wall biosynthesis
MNGIDTYAEQVALAARAVGHDTTLLVTTGRVADAVRARIEANHLRIVDLGLRPVSGRQQLAERLAPTLQTLRVGRALRAAIRAGLGEYDVLHLNRPSLAPHARHAAARVFCAGWFYPHAPVGRMIETWRHTRGSLHRRLFLVGKSLAFYLADDQGYRVVDGVVACTTSLATQLRLKGLRAFVCPPPVNLFAGADGGGADDRRADGTTLCLLVCSGDLSHPRKNLVDAVRVAGALAQTRHRVELRAIGRRPRALEEAVRALPAGVRRNVRLDLLGPRSPTEVREEMRRADVFLLPSLYEEWGYVAVEALLSGTPVATYPVYPFADMLAGELGVVAQSMAPESLAIAVERAAAGTRGQSLALAGARRFGSTAVGERLSAIWRGEASAEFPGLADGDGAAAHPTESDRNITGRAARLAGRSTT